MEKELKLFIGTIDKVKLFVHCNEQYDLDIDVKSGRYIIDGKSIMGMFSFDLSKELTVIIRGQDDKAVESLIEDYKNNKLL